MKQVLLLFLLLFTLRKCTTSGQLTASIHHAVPDPANLQNHQCNHDLGMQSGDIRDDQISVSSSLPGARYGKENARLDSDGAWVSVAHPDAWIEIDLRKVMMVSGVRTQGKAMTHFGHLWMSTYQVKYRVNETAHWKMVSRGARNIVQNFAGNTDAYKVKTNYFDQPVKAQFESSQKTTAERCWLIPQKLTETLEELLHQNNTTLFIRIVPQTWPRHRNKLALRLELIGCNVRTGSGCDSPRVLTSQTGLISSMNYPKKYDNNANCTWDIVAPPDQTIILQFGNGLALEDGFCYTEYVEVFDFIDNVPVLLEKLCGKEPPKLFHSSNNRLKITFMSDHYETDVGFQAQYKFVNGSKCAGPRILHGVSGEIHSMHYPHNYENNASCEWDIAVEKGMIIEVTFTDMHIPEELPLSSQLQNHCPTDSVQILEYNEKKQIGRIERFCGITNPKPFLSKTNKLRVTFQSNHRITGGGFRALYNAVPASGCGGKRDLTEARGTIQTLNHPDSYPTDLQCEWNIIGQNNQDIQIKFLAFNLEQGTDCQYDSVSIYDGLDTQHLLGKYCNSPKIHPLEAHSGAMKVIFVSDEQSNQYSGFKASYIVRTRPALTSTPKSTLAAITTDFTETPVTKNTDIADTSTTQAVLKQKTTITETSFTTFKQIQISKHMSNTENTNSESNIPPSSGLFPPQNQKWIIIALASVSGMLLLLVMFGGILCCRQQITGTSINIQQGSQKNVNNSSVMQNHAYDFSLASTNHSTKSRQAEPTELSQVSESFSHQGTLPRSPSPDGHIYFSIEDCRDSRKNTESTTSAHYKKQENQKSANFISDDSVAEQSDEEVDEDEYYDDDDLESYSICLDILQEPEGRISRQNTMEHTTIPIKQKEKSQVQKGTSGPKMMVDNILYESADSMDQD